jgi:hypothetical protein
MTAPAAYKESPTQFKESGGWTVAQPQDAALRGKWWEIYNEPELNALEDQLNIDNQNIRQAFESFMEARARSISPRSALAAPIPDRGHHPMLDQRPAAAQQAVSNHRCFLFLVLFLGNPIFGTKSATRCAPANTKRS